MSTPPDNVRTPFGPFPRTSVFLDTPTQIHGNPTTAQAPTDNAPYLQVMLACCNQPIFAVPNATVRPLNAIDFDGKPQLARAQFSFPIPVTPPPNEVIFILLGFVDQQYEESHITVGHVFNSTISINQGTFVGDALYWVLQWGTSAAGGGNFWSLAPWWYNKGLPGLLGAVPAVPITSIAHNNVATVGMSIAPEAFNPFYYGPNLQFQPNASSAQFVQAAFLTPAVGYGTMDTGEPVRNPVSNLAINVSVAQAGQALTPVQQSLWKTDVEPVLLNKNITATSTGIQLSY
jgi:hypothetical protein